MKPSNEKRTVEKNSIELAVLISDVKDILNHLDEGFIGVIISIWKMKELRAFNSIYFTDKFGVLQLW